MEGIDRVFRAQASRAGQESWLREVQGLTARAAYALARLDRAEEAAVALEKGLAVILVDALGRDPARLDDLEALGHHDLATTYRTAAGLMRDLTRAAADGELGAPADPGVEVMLNACREQLDGVIEAIRRVDGFESFLLPPTIRDVRAALLPAEESSCLAYLAVTTAGAVVLIVTADSVEAIRLELTRAELGEFLVQAEGETVVGGYAPGQLWSEAFLAEALERAPALIGERLIEPLAARLRGLRRVDVALIPSGWLALLPLGASGTGPPGRGRACLTSSS